MFLLCGRILGASCFDLAGSCAKGNPIALLGDRGRFRPETFVRQRAAFRNHSAFRDRCFFSCVLCELSSRTATAVDEVVPRAMFTSEYLVAFGVDS